MTWVNYYKDGSLNEPADESLWLLVESVSREAAKRFGPHIDRADVREGVSRYVRSRGFSDSDLEDPEVPGTQELERVLLLRRALSVVAERTARTLRGSTLGYGVEDEAYYGIGYLGELLEAIFHGGLSESPPVGGETEVVQASDGAQSGGYLVSLLDTKKALSAMDKAFREILWLRYGPLVGLSGTAVLAMADGELLARAGVTAETLRAVLGADAVEVDARTLRALRALQAATGGRTPWAGGGTIWEDLAGYALGHAELAPTG